MSLSPRRNKSNDGSSVNRMSMSGKIISPSTDDDDSSVDLERIEQEQAELDDAPKSLRDFFRESQVRLSTAKIMVGYDKDGDGHFSKAEVLHIIQDLQNQNKINDNLAVANKILKRILIGSVIFFFLLIASVFGLTFAVANLTKETTVDTASGALYATNSNIIVATNSRADVFIAESYDGYDCMLTSDATLIKEDILKGTNVMLQRNSITGSNVTLEELTAKGAFMDQDVTESGDVIVNSNGQICFYVPESGPAGNPYYCIVPVGPDHPCSTGEPARRLASRALAQLEASGDALDDEGNLRSRRHHRRQLQWEYPDCEGDECASGGYFTNGPWSPGR